MLYDADGNELTYWHVTGLVAGQDSEVLVIGIDCPVEGRLSVTDDPRLEVWAKMHGVEAPFVNIADDPIDLSTETGRIFFDVKLHAASDIVGFERVALSPGTTRQLPAAWRG